MATAVMNGSHQHIRSAGSADHEVDPFTDSRSSTQQSPSHRYSSFFDTNSLNSDVASSPSQVKRTLKAHLAETERRLQNTHKLGTTLLQQQTQLSEKLKEVEDQGDESEIPTELRRQLVELEKEHNEVGREIAKALIGPKTRNISGEEKHVPESPAAFSSQATGSPSKVSVPTRRQRNQQSSRAGDIQFAADISTSLLAQVRQLQAALAERDDSLKTTLAENTRLERDSEGLSQRLRAHDENEQRYKDENWNLETQRHDLLAASQEAAAREEKLHAGLAAALADKSRAQNDLDEAKLAHGKLLEDHAATKKSHDSEVHALKRTVDVGDEERTALQSKLDELTSQNQELARAVAGRYRSQNVEGVAMLDAPLDDMTRDLSTPEHSPPPSPTKATPRHGGLESETLKSSLHHAHRMIQNLKGNIHREKTEKIELKRMLQEARDELEQRDGGLGSGNKRQKTKSDVFKKPARPDMLGGSRKARTDVEVNDEDWEDNANESPSRVAGSKGLKMPHMPGSYLTSTDAETSFETADERHGTESEDFQTGAESLAGDSSDELTETEGRVERAGTVRGRQLPLALKKAGDRSSYLSTASTSAGEEDLYTPIESQPQKFRLKNPRQSVIRHSRSPLEDTPGSYRDQATPQDSPASTSDTRSPPAAEQSLFTELGGFNDASSDMYSTPGKASIVSHASTPGARYVASPQPPGLVASSPEAKAAMTDSATMTEPWEPEANATQTEALGGAAAGVAVGTLAGAAITGHKLPSPSPSMFPLPPSMPNSPQAEPGLNNQYTPIKSALDSPAKSMPAFITPPKTVWDEAHDRELDRSGPSERQLTSKSAHQPALALSHVLAQDTVPETRQETPAVVHVVSPAAPLSFSPIQSQETLPVQKSEEQIQDSPTIPPTYRQDYVSKPESSNTSKTPLLAAGAALTTAAAALGLAETKDSTSPTTAEDGMSQSVTHSDPFVEPKRAPLKEISGNVEDFKDAPPQKVDMIQERPRLVTVASNDQSSQTMLTSDQIEQALSTKSPPTPFMAPVTAPVMTPTRAMSPSATTPQSTSRTRDVSAFAEAAPLVVGAAAAAGILKRPASAGSQRPASVMSSHPPLPPDHKSTIAKAAARSTSPANELAATAGISNTMGPPIAPASAYRRPQTSAGRSQSEVQSPARASVTPRASHASQNGRYRGAMGSQLSRRSSVSSFASEIDERFNIHTDNSAPNHGFEPGPNTDPRMIQAITQTMIGEFLWKYTRKAGRTEMSNTRHRRYFWVHPYTKTLYWSDQDPQTAGRSQLKAKSVAIQSVRVVSDDNPMPPGLHRKSLEIVTPGRKVKFTAPTGQRHETWFNALSYLLLRGEDPSGMGAYSAGGNDITADDVNEFNAGYGSYGRNPDGVSSRLSMSSYNSRTTRGTSAVRSNSRMSMRQSLPPGVVASTASKSFAQQDSVASRTTATQYTDGPSTSEIPQLQQDRYSQSQPENKSRISKMFGTMTSGSKRGRPSEAGAAGMTRTPSNTQGRSQSRHGAAANQGSIYNASIVSANGHDSAEDLRQDKLKQERESHRLENVRACCDGKHDVSTLAAGGKHTHDGHGHSHSHSLSRRHRSMDRLSKSVSRRPTGTLTGPSATTSAQGVAQSS